MSVSVSMTFLTITCSSLTIEREEPVTVRPFLSVTIHRDSNGSIPASFSGGPGFNSWPRDRLS
jgi:hypothetical protein